MSEGTIAGLTGWPSSHGHSVATMLRVYTAWMDSAPESDIAAIKDAMGMAPSPTLPAMNTTANSRILVKTARIAPALIAATSRLFEKIKKSRLPIRIWHSKRSAAIQLTDLPTKRSGGEGGIRTHGRN